ncbi:hypothetical protein P3W43_07340 [Salinicola salarius]|uniref:hypothetical protein n=1 Tax=Salinicola salarius TaxID=430457 RepID=UPI0023E4042C|nr:hypothetical protein [Salinicola salarius]MDF3918667.1 hypothetical protein [Salinicola salarius]
MCTQTPDFYINQILKTVEHSRAGDIQGVGTSVFSFFSGQEYINGKKVTVESRHIEVLFKSEELNSWCLENKETILEWIMATFWYFRSMSAIPEIADAIWLPLAKVVECFRENELEALHASFQLASWDFFYGEKRHPSYLQHIKNLTLKSKKAKVDRSLFNSTAINKNHEDYNDNIVYAYENRNFLSGPNLAISIIHYYCHINPSNRVINELKGILKRPDLAASIKYGNCDFLKPLIGNLYDNNNYKTLLDLLRELKEKSTDESFNSGHAFLLSNGKNLVLMSNSGVVKYIDQENYETYKKLIRSSNISTNTAISLLGEFGEPTDYFDEKRRGAPPVEDNLETLAEATTNHFQLQDDIYSEINLLTLCPSHNFPIQSTLFYLEKSSPIISTSLENISDDPDEKKFVFFLSRQTLTYNIEKEFIEKEFGTQAEIITDPPEDIFLEKIKSHLHNIIYISAHGEYDHWGNKHYDEIYFSEDARIPSQKLNECSPPSGMKKNIILNICDGATTEISCNPYNRSIAASMARGNQTVISHLWPVNPIYACAFGMLIIYFLKTESAIEATRLTFKTLNNTNAKIIQESLKLSQSFSILEDFIKTKDFTLKNFKNIGSMAVYS